MSKKKSKSGKSENPLVVTSADGKATAVFHGTVGEVINADKIEGGVHLTLDADFWK